MSAEAAAHEEGAEDAALGKDAWRDGGMLLPPDLNQDKGNEQHDSHDQQSYDTSIVPLDSCQLPYL
jgi:hypothetical protein